jgi:putative transcriptional regulator
MQAVIETPAFLRHAKAAGLTENEFMTKKLTASERILVSAKQALAFAEGADNGCVVHIPDEINVARIRKNANMSQRQFAAYFGVNVRTIQEWEQGRAVPSGPSRALLMVIDREPQAVRRALTGASQSSKVRVEHLIG